MDNKSLCPDIISSGCEYYDDQISGSDSWELFSSLSSLRRAALLWYPVSKSACALDLGCGFGALTGVLCDKAGHVVAADPDPVCAEGTEKRYSRRPGLSVLCAGAEEALKGRTFDLILVQDIERICSGPDRLFELIKDHLSAEGRLLIMFRNRLGIGYACGRTDEKVPEPGAAMASGSTLHAAGELEEKLKKAGFGDLRRYYLYPDRYFTQAVFSDEFMPSGCISDRVLTYDPFGTGSAARAAAEHRQLDMLAAEGLLGKMANDVLLECFLPGTARAGKHVTGAYISADREAPNAFCTVFLSGGTVEKRPVFAEGAQTLRSAAENISELSARGIETVPHSLTEDAGGAVLAMPFADGTPMLDALSALLAEDAEGAKALLRQLWEDILRSSEHCLDQSEKFAFSDGPVLKKGFVDMIPLNAFVKDGKIVYYDQEFTEERCPARYIMYRALRYTWLALRGAEEKLPLEEMKAIYGLTELWDRFGSIEDAFTHRNRQRDRFAQVYRWAWGEKPYGTGLVMGTFDLFHVGHLNLLKRAKDRCRKLRVGVLSDELVFRYKNKYPVIPLGERMEIIRALSCVDEVVPIEGEYVSKVAEWYKRPYDCFFSGDDHIDDEYWKKEKEELAALGCGMEFFPYTKEESSTMIRARLGKDGGIER